MALALGKTLAELEAMPHDEFVGWQAFYSLEPWGCEAEDHRAATALNFHWAVNSKPNSEPPRWFDRDPQSRVKADPTPEQLDESIRDFFIGKTVKAPTPEKKPRKQRSDKGKKRPPSKKAPSAK